MCSTLVGFGAAGGGGSGTGSDLWAQWCGFLSLAQRGADNSCHKCLCPWRRWQFFPNKQQEDVYLRPPTLRARCVFALVSGQGDCHHCFSFLLHPTSSYLYLSLSMYFSLPFPFSPVIFPPVLLLSAPLFASLAVKHSFRGHRPSKCPLR